jgi:hypothetical protein
MPDRTSRQQATVTTMIDLSVREGRPARRWVAALVAVLVPLTLLYPTFFG